MDFEKLGAFYLGKQFDTSSATLSDQFALYESKHLTTHAVIIGMTGSGKTGLGIGLLEEALVDNIPVIAIDPKGDLTNLLLTFPNLEPTDFEGWVNPELAAQNGKSVSEFASNQAETWKKGLSDWGQDGERIRKMREAVDFTIYTPGSSAGVPVSVLRNFDAPAAEVLNDADAFRERIQSTVTGLLGLLGIEADPIRSREHILISSILNHAWSAGKSLDLGGLIGQIQQPPMQKVGVMDIDSFYPSKERFELAMSINNLLASPGFAAWMEGEPLEVKNFLFKDGKPRLSVFYIAHLSDAERMFFVSSLLNATLGWMRQQSGTPSLRAMLYMDEIFGYFPPNGNPPSKTPMLTLLKQARAFGLGLVLSTQNPVDLDYKGLANTGTWFIGRLQTDNDKARVLEALQSAGGASANELDKVLSSLGKRVFLMHSVNLPKPMTFQTRWTMSYLAGPLTLEQIKVLMRDKKATSSAAKESASTVGAQHAAPAPQASSRPALPPTIKQFFLPTSSDGVTYYPMLLASANVRYSSVKQKIDTNAPQRFLVEITDNPVPVVWDDAQSIDFEVNNLETEPLDGAGFNDLASSANNAKNFDKWGKDFAKWLCSSRPLTLFSSAKFKAISNPGESEDDFRARLTQIARETRDSSAEAIQKKYESKIVKLQDQLARAQAKQAEQQAQAQQAQLQAVVNVGIGVLGALFGGGGRRSSVASKVGSGLRGAGKAYKEGQDVSRAADSIEEIQAELGALQEELSAELESVSAVDPNEPLETVEIKAKSTDVSLELLALAWVPYAKDAQGRLVPAWA
jgi:Helicase HerA, central domain